MDYPLAVAEKAKRLEQLLQRIAAGERLAEMNEELDFNLDAKQLTQAQAKYEAGEGQWEALVDGRYGHPQKVHSGIREWLYSRKEKDQAVRAPQLAREIEAKFAVEVEPGHLNYLLRKRGLTARPGHPPKPETGDQEREAGSAPGESLGNAPLFTADGTGQDSRPTGQWRFPTGLSTVGAVARQPLFVKQLYQNLDLLILRLPLNRVRDECGGN